MGSVGNDEDTKQDKPVADAPVTEGVTEPVVAEDVPELPPGATEPPLAEQPGEVLGL